MQWYILLFIICILLLLYNCTYSEGFVSSTQLGLVKAIANIPSETTPDANAPINNAFGKDVFNKKQEYYIASPSEATSILLEDIAFCKDAARSNDPFSDSRFADTCGICMTQGTILLDKTPFSHGKNRLGTGVVVYKNDKEFSLREGSQAIPSSHSAFCDNLVINNNYITPNMRVSGLAINAQQYKDTTEYLKSMNIVSFMDTTSCSPTVSQPILCENENTTIASIRFLYGHFNDGCEAGSNGTYTEEMSSQCQYEQSCTFSSNLPSGQRQWYLNAECKIQQETIPSGLIPLYRRSITGLKTTMSNFPYYWADPYASIDNDIRTFTVYKQYSVSQDTQIQVEYATNASFDLYLHTLRQYTQPNPGNNFVYQSNTASKLYTLYKGDNIFKLKVKSTNVASNGLYFKVYDVTGNPLLTLDSSWLCTPTPAIYQGPIGRFPVHAVNVWSNLAVLSPKNPSTTTINYFMPIELPSEKLLTLGVFMLDTTNVFEQNPAITCKTYILHNNREKLVSSNTNVAYLEFFPKGHSLIRISVNGNKNTWVFAILGDADKNIIASTTSSSLTDEQPPPPPPSKQTAYQIQDFVVLTGPGTDRPNQPMTGTQTECMNACTGDSRCLGFSFSKEGDPNSPQKCWLKEKLDPKTYKTVYNTYVKLE